MRSGIAVAGSILVDELNEIFAYPKAGELTKIVGVQKAVGGCVPNVGIDLKRIDDNLTVQAIGKVSDDENGLFVTEQLAKNGVDVNGIVRGKDKTSFTQVMSVKGGQRTFFTYAGASADFGYEDFDFQNLQVKMLHLGYFLLLDKIDNGDGEKILRKAQELGIKTSIDLVSENSDRYKLVIPCLQYTDNLIINETEAGKITGIEPLNKNLKEIAEQLKNYGVKERVIIHTPAVSVCLSEQGFFVLPSFDLPDGFIKGTTGAGDAFCAGCLIGIYRDLTDEEILKLGSLSATAALSGVDAISGMRSEKEMEILCKNLERKQICL